jgi:hypothetical protein
MRITQVVTAPRSPLAEPYVERVTGSIRREYLDHVVIFNERHLRRVLPSYVDYYHRTRTHLSARQGLPLLSPYSATQDRKSGVYTASRPASSPRTPRRLTRNRSLRMV